MGKPNKKMISANEGVLAPGPVAFLPRHSLKEKFAMSLCLSIVPRMIGTNWWLLGLHVLGLLWVLYLTYPVWHTLVAVSSRDGYFMTKIITSLVLVQVTEEKWFGADEAPETVQEWRRNAFNKLRQKLVIDRWTKEQLLMFEKDIKADPEDRKVLHDHIEAPFQSYAGPLLSKTTFCDKSEECFVIDINGNKTMDISGAFGVNVAGHDKFKEFQEKGTEKMRASSPVALGGCFHRVISEVVANMRKISKLDEVSFHMSGTEAVMATMKLARFNTGRRLVVKLEHSYHGWCESIYTEMHDANTWPKDIIMIKPIHAFKFIASRRNEIACVLIDPFITMAGYYSDFGFLMESEKQIPLSARIKKVNELGKQRDIDSAKKLRALCTANKVPLVVDEIWSGFKWSFPGSASAVLGIQGDFALYGKAAAGGLPTGVVCGRSWLMKRFQKDRPLGSTHIAGTFAASPLILGTLSVCLEWALLESTQKQYEAQVKLTSESIGALNDELDELKLPFYVWHFGLFFGIAPKIGGAYLFLLRYYLLSEGLVVNQTSFGMCQCSMEFKPEHYSFLTEAIKNALKQWIDDKWISMGGVDPLDRDYYMGQGSSVDSHGNFLKLNDLEEPLLA